MLSEPSLLFVRWADLRSKTSEVPQTITWVQLLYHIMTSNISQRKPKEMVEYEKEAPFQIKQNTEN